MPFALHTFLAPRKPEYFPPLPGLPTYSAAPAAPAIFEDLGLEDDIVFDEVFLDIMGLNESSVAQKHVSEPITVPRNDSIVAPLLMNKRKASIANCLTSQSTQLEFGSTERVRQARSKSVSAASGKHIRPADLLKPLPLLPMKDVPAIEWSAYTTASPTIGFSKYTMARKMSVPNKFLSVNFSGSNIPIPLPPRSPKRFGVPATL
ncbi:hypothetical protein ABW19_dt0204434 [Dactylella cylindrospora]|nr:hypothetical protein ABW19_dt0204434 [Dactylella cylindrospora]